MFRLHTNSKKDWPVVISYLWKCKKLQIVYIIVAAMDKDIVATAAKDVHLVPDEIADDNANEHAVQEAQDASMYCCLEEC